MRRHADAWHLTSLADDDAAASRENAGTLLAAARREVFEEAGIEVEANALVPWANWVTPPDQPKRFDTFFYVASLPPGTEPRHQTTEASSSSWMAVRAVLDGEDAQTLRLMPPTLALLQELLEIGSVEAVLRMRRDIVPVLGPEGSLQEFLRHPRLPGRQSA